MSTYVAQMNRALGIFQNALDSLTYRKAALLTELHDQYLPQDESGKFLDIGCGVGLTDLYLYPTFRHLHGTDVDLVALQEAQRRNHGVIYTLSDGRNFPYEDAKFPMACAINVLHHVPQKQRDHWFNEVFRVLEPGGLVVFIEHNPFNPLTRWIVSRCECDKDAELLTRASLKKRVTEAGFQIVETKFTLLAAQYFVAALRP